MIIGARAMERTLVQGGLKSNQLNSKSTTATYATHDTNATWLLLVLLIVLLLELLLECFSPCGGSAPGDPTRGPGSLLSLPLSSPLISSTRGSCQGIVGPIHQRYHCNYCL